MYEELDVLEEIGLGTSKEIQQILDIGIRNVIKHLSKLEKRQEISVIIFNLVMVNVKDVILEIYQYLKVNLNYIMLLNQYYQMKKYYQVIQI